MTNRMAREFREKLMSPAEAVKLVKSGDTIYIGTTSSTANVMCAALAGRADELEGLTLTAGIGTVSETALQKLNPKTFAGINTCFMGSWERGNRGCVPVDFTSVHLSQVDIWCTQTAPPDVAFLEVSPPDADGYMSLGPLA